MDSTLLSSMDPGHFVVRSWIPKQSTQTLHDTITIYDGGDKQGFLIKEPSGKTTWIVFQVDYRLIQEDNTILEGCVILHETEAPLHYFSKETLPGKLQQESPQQWLLHLPQTLILLSLSEDPSFHPTLSLFPQLSLPPLPKAGGPGSHGPQRSDSRRPVGGRPMLQNKSRTLPTEGLIFFKSKPPRAAWIASSKEAGSVSLTTFSSTS